MSNFKRGDKVQVIRDGHFLNGYQGTITKIKVVIQFSDNMGEWTLNDDEIKSLEKSNNKINSVDEFKEVVGNNIEEFKQVATKATKATKAKDQKPKRSYNRKAK